MKGIQFILRLFLTPLILFWSFVVALFMLVVIVIATVKFAAYEGKWVLYKTDWPEMWAYLAKPLKKLWGLK